MGLPVGRVEVGLAIGFVAVAEGGGVLDERVRLHVGSTRGVTVLTVEGEMDIASASLLHSALEELKSKRVILDFSGLTFVDSAGARLLAFHSLRMRRAGGALLVRCPWPQTAAP